MARQIIETRETEDQVVAKIDRDLVFTTLYENPSLAQSRAVEMTVIDESPLDNVAKRLGKRKNVAENVIIEGKLDLQYRLAASEFELDL